MMSKYYIISFLAFGLYIAVFYIGFTASLRKTKKAFNNLIDNPDQISEFWRSKRDGDGYVRLHVRTKTGDELIIGHVDADEYEKMLRAVCNRERVVCTNNTI